MNKSAKAKDFFISYTSEDEDWATWIAETLESNGYTTIIQAWDFKAGGTFISDMHEAEKTCAKVMPVLSKKYLEKPYCLSEWQNVFVDDPIGEKGLIIPVRIENVKPDGILKARTYIDLFGLDKESAMEKLLSKVEEKPSDRKSKGFPGKSFPGKLPTNNLTDCNPRQVKIRDIIILETDKRKKKELFNRLVYDVFHALGFGNPQYDVPKPGRGIDIVLQHRTENRYALVVSRAQKEKVGESDINKFVGVLDVERGKYERDGGSAIGYFIAQSGFKASALEQEDERIKTRKERNEKSELVLLGPEEIARELIQANVLCSIGKAFRAVRQTSGGALTLCENVDLIACEQGWIWVLYYARLPRKTATHFAFVHADGNQLLNGISDVLLSQTRSKAVAFSNLTYLAATLDASLDKQAARDAYFKYLESELGEIQFEGMPTDKEAGAVKVNLENIFVPLCFNYTSLTKRSEKPRLVKTTIDGVLSRTSRAAILAKPGGGKSTLIRRIALAYAYPKRRLKVDDGLPNCNWFPVYIRCRDLGDDATKSISEIIGTIVYRAEITKYKGAFEALIGDALQDGRILLLIDGLDEISSEKHRICFVNQLRTFVATYPTVHLIATSREAGFRAVAGTLASYCEQYSIAPLQEKEIRYLSLKWHQAILGESDQTEADSNKVCNIILNDARIMTLAENPLLLTTLLFVKRWVGYLPTKKCRLYEEMIKLLLVTWNAAGHDKLDMDETEPQLAFVAYCMTIQGQQKITRNELDKCIIGARKALPELLSYTKISPSRFIDQVEERSSLLIQMGLEESNNGQWVPSYEFSHLSFQEYLTAKAIAESWIPDSYNYNPLEILKPHISEDHWKEVIPLIAVLLGRQAKPLIDYLVELSANDKLSNYSTYKQEPINSNDIAPLHLANCIASEVPMSQELLEKAITIVVERKKAIERISRWHSTHGSINVFDTIVKSKYESNYKEVIKKALFCNSCQNLYEFSDEWIRIYRFENKNSLKLYDTLQLLKSQDYERQITGALLMMHLAFSRKATAEKNSIDPTIMTNIFLFISQMLQADDTLSIYSAAWCIAWSGYNEADIIPYEILPSIAKRLVDLWINQHSNCVLKRMVSWALYSICMPDLPKSIFLGIPRLAEAIEDYYSNPTNDFDRNTAINLAVLTNSWTQEETKKRIDNSNKMDTTFYQHETYSRYLKESGFHK